MRVACADACRALYERLLILLSFERGNGSDSGADRQRGRGGVLPVTSSGGRVAEGARMQGRMGADDRCE